MDTSGRQTPENTDNVVMDTQAVKAEMFQAIFTNCDSNNLGQVAPSVVIDYIKPFFQEDLHDLENLKHLLDPDRNDALLNKEKFLEIMNNWSHQLCTNSSPEQEFGSPTSRLSISAMHGNLSYKHSTPRPSIGDKLLKCRELLNISNVSGYSLSTSQLEHQVDLDKTVLEEEIKKLEHQLSKTMSELNVLQEQLSTTEDLNDKLRFDLEKVTRKLQAEQQINEQLRQNIKQTDELQDELDNYRKTVSDLKKKLAEHERENIDFQKYIVQLEYEKSELEKNISKLSKESKEITKELFDVKLECETKDAQITQFSGVFKEVELKLKEQKDLNDQLKEEIDLLKHQKSSLIKNTKVRQSLSLSIEQKEDKGHSSDEDISWRLQHGNDEIQDDNCKSLRDELPKVKKSDSPSNAAGSRVTGNLYTRNVNLRLTEKCSEQEKTIIQLNEKLRTQCNNLIDAQKMTTSLNLKVEQLQQELSEVKSAKIQLEKEVQELKNARLKIENIDTVVEQVQSHVTEKSSDVPDLKHTIERLKSSLETKVDCCLNLKNQISKDLDQKNALWSRAKILEKDLNDKILEISQLTELHEELKLKYNDLLISYNAEVNKCNQFKSQSHDKDTQTVDVTLDNAELGLELLDDLKKNYSRKVAENRKLTADLGKMKDDYTRIRTELDTLKQKVNFMKANVIDDLGKAEKFLKANVAEIEQKDLQIEKLEQQVAELNSAENAVLEQMKLAKEQLDSQLKELNATYQSKLESLITGKLESDQLKEKLEQELQETHTKINSINAEYLKVLSELDSFKTEHLELTNKLNQTKSELFEITEQSNDDKAQLTKLKTTSQNACKQVETLNSENILLTTKLEEAKLEIHQMQSQLNHLNKEHQNVLTKLQSAETKNSKLTQELHLTQRGIVNKDFQLNSLEKEIQSQQANYVGQLEQAKTEIGRLQKQLCNIKSELEQCKTALQDKETQLKQLSNTNHELSSELLMIKREKEELDVDCACLKKNVNTLEQTTKRLKDKLAKMTSNSATSENHLTLQNTLIHNLEGSLQTCNEEFNKIKAERDDLKLELDKLQQAVSLMEGAKKQSFSKQEIVIEKLKRKNELLETKLKLLEDELKQQVELSKRKVGVEVEVQTLEVELDLCECKRVSKFTVVNDKTLDHQSLDEEPTSPNSTKKFEDNAHKHITIDDNVEVPALEISFSGDFLDSLDISGSGKNLSKTELEEKVTAITLFLVTSSGNISKKIEREIEVYKTKYESLLSLLADISYRLRDHVCIGTPEPIVPVYVMLEEVKLQLKSLVHNASQVGALICEEKMKRCWNPLINYTALLRQRNEKLEKITSDSASSKQKNAEIKPLKGKLRRHLNCCWKINAVLVFTLTCAVIIGFIVNLTCRLTSPDSHYCPLDNLEIVRRLRNGIPPM